MNREGKGGWYYREGILFCWGKIERIWKRKIIFGEEKYIVLSVLICQRPGGDAGQGHSIFGRWQLWAPGLNWWHVWKLCGMPILPVRGGRRQRNTAIMKWLWIFEEDHIHNRIVTPDRRNCSRWTSCSWWWGASASLKIFSRKSKGFHRCQLDDVI